MLSLAMLYVSFRVTMMIASSVSPYFKDVHVSYGAIALFFLLAGAGHVFAGTLNRQSSSSRRLRWWWVAGLVSGSPLVITYMFLGINQNPGVPVSASIKQAMVNLRNQAEIYYDNNSDSYAGVCQSEYIVEALDSVAVMNEDNPPACFDSLAAYAAEAGLPGGGFWCVDSIGTTNQFKERTIAADDFECGG